LAALTLPTVQPRPIMYTKVSIPPLSFDQTELEHVFGELNARMQDKGRRTLSRVLWRNDELKHRRVTLQTSKELPLGHVLRVLQDNAGIQIDDSGRCRTCGGPISVLEIRDAAAEARQPAAGGMR